ncbi:MAG: NfeD family protein [Microthrixaceae bacterium]
MSTPLWILVAVTCGSMFLLVELALPTLGIAGITGTVLVGLGLYGLAHSGENWLPLLGIALATALAALLLTSSTPNPLWLGIALAALVGGGVGFGLLAGDNATVVGAFVSGGLAAVGYPHLHAATRRLVDRPDVVGLGSYLGRTATVTDWSGVRGTVVLDGTRWNARWFDRAVGPFPPVSPGQEVTVRDHDGLELLVGPTDTAAVMQEPHR